MNSMHNLVLLFVPQDSVMRTISLLWSAENHQSSTDSHPGSYDHCIIFNLRPLTAKHLNNQGKTAVSYSLDAGCYRCDADLESTVS